MSNTNNITIFLLISLFISCSSSETKKIIDITDTPFYSVDSVYIVTPSYKIENDHFTMGLELEKRKNINEHYFPSSEQLRVIIKDAKGNTLLNTGGEGKNFLTEVTPVEPQIVGEKHNYEYNMTGITLLDEREEIEIYLILPMKPNEIAYSKRIRLCDDN